MTKEIQTLEAALELLIDLTELTPVNKRGPLNSEWTHQWDVIKQVEDLVWEKREELEQKIDKLVTSD